MNVKLGFDVTKWFVKCSRGVHANRASVVDLCTCIMALCIFVVCVLCNYQLIHGHELRKK